MLTLEQEVYLRCILDALVSAVQRKNETFIEQKVSDRLSKQAVTMVLLEQLIYGMVSKEL